MEKNKLTMGLVIGGAALTIFGGIVSTIASTRQMAENIDQSVEEHLAKRESSNEE